MLLNSRFPRRRRNSDQCRTNLESEPPEGLQVSSNAKVRTSMIESQQQKQRGEPSFAWVLMCASVYVLSGVTQPILMSFAKQKGLADPKCQLYMLFYYIGPALVAFTLRCRSRNYSSGKRNGDGSNYNGASYGATSILLQSKKSNAALDDDSRGSKEVDGAIYYDYEEDYDDDGERSWPPRPLLIKASAIAVFDIFAQSMVYTGNNLAGPTIFSIIYSSVTIWAAIYSKFLLSRSLSKLQWTGVTLVVLGLSLTAVDSLALGKNVFLGACLIVVGTSFHGLTYVFSEKIMTDIKNESISPLTISLMNTALTSTDADCINNTRAQVRRETSRLQRQRHHEIISVRANCAIQGLVATAVLLVWQLIYTIPQIQPLILIPMSESQTSPLHALLILSAIAISNLFHSITFFVTLKHLAGGATSAGVLKGLQAILVFCASSVFLCGRWDGGREMCWSASKLVSLAVVLCGIALYTRGMYGMTRKKKMDDGEIMCV